jgi:hypothetical protein
VGEAVYVDSSAEDTIVDNVRALRTNTGTYLAASRVDRGAIFDNGIRTTVRDCRLELCGGPAIEAYTGATGFFYERNLARNPCQLTATNPYGIFVNVGVAVITGHAHNNRFVVTDGLCTTALRASNGNTTLFAMGNVASGITTPWNFGSKVQHQSNLPGPFVSVGNAVAKTIASDAIDVTDVLSGYVGVDGEGGLADNLATINGGVTGQVVTFKRGGSVTITVKHGTGNIVLRGAVDHALNGATPNVRLRKDGATWIEDGV